MSRKNSMFFTVIIIITMVLALTMITGCISGSETNTAAPAPTPAPGQYTTLKTTSSTGSVGIIDIADAKDFFDEQGIKIDYVGNVNGGTESVQALASGQIDFAGSAWQPWINSNNRGARLKVVVAGTGQNAKEPGILWIVHNNSSINSAKDLVGKKIAVNVLGAEADYVTRAYLKNAGLNISQVQLIVVPWPQHEQVFKSNQVDVVAANSPHSDKILAGGNARVLFSNYDVRGQTASLGYGFREDFIKQNPTAVKSFVTALAKAEDWTVANPDEARKLVAEIFVKKGGNPDLAKYWSPRQAWPHGLLKDQDFQWWLNEFAADGLIKPGQYKPSDYYTNEFNPYNQTQV